MIYAIIIVIIAAVLAYAATRPGSFRVERSTAVKAPPDKVYALLDDFHAWKGWSPWEKLDAGMQRTQSGAPRGKGAVYAWQGNRKVGSGRMEILQADAASKLVIKLDFLKPFEAHNTAEFTLQPQGGATQVSWAMHGPRPYAVKLMGLFFNMDAMIGRDFEAGLANLKALVER